MRRPRILIVEDDAGLRGMLARALVPYGFDTATAASSREALEAVSRESFDAIICDVRIPGMNGIQTLREARRHLPQVRGIVITGYASETAPVEAIEAGVDGYFRKPFDLEALARLLREKLEEVMAKQEEERRTSRREARYHKLLVALAGELGGEKAAGVLDPLVDGDPEGKTLVSLIVSRSGTREAGSWKVPYDQERRCRTYLELGLAYSDAEAQDLASDALGMALELVPEIADHLLAAEVLYAAGKLALRDGKWDQTREMREQLLRMEGEPLGIPELLARILGVHLTAVTSSGESLDSEIASLLPRVRDASRVEEEAELLLLEARAARGAGEEGKAQASFEKAAEVIAPSKLWPLFARELPHLLPFLMAAAARGPSTPAVQALLEALREHDRERLTLLLDEQDAETRALSGRFLSAMQGGGGELRVHTFGAVRLFRNGVWCVEGDFRRRKVKYLLVYLLWHWPGSVSEEKLMELFWPDLSPDRARRVLYNHVYLLRHILEPELRDGRKSKHLVASQEQYRFEAAGPVWCDLHEFRDSIRRGRDLVNRGEIEAGMLLLAAAARLYSGSFVTECLDDWCQELRSALEADYVWAGKRVAEYWEGTGAWDRAVEAARKILVVDPVDEEEHRRLMRCLMELGRQDQAKKQFELCRTRLKLDLEADPSPDTIALYLRAGGSL